MSFGQLMIRPPPKTYYYGGVDDEGYEFANLLAQVNKKLMIHLECGKTIIGRLNSVDNFSNLFLTEAVDRIYVGKTYGDINVGSILVRGNSIVLVGEIDEENEEARLKTLEKLPLDEILHAQKEQQELTELREKKRMEAFKERGLQYIPLASTTL